MAAKMDTRPMAAGNTAPIIKVERPAEAGVSKTRRKTSQSSRKVSVAAPTCDDRTLSTELSPRKATTIVEQQDTKYENLLNRAKGLAQGLVKWMGSVG